MRGLLDYVLVHSPLPVRPDASETGTFRAVTGVNVGDSRFTVAPGEERGQGACAPCA